MTDLPAGSAVECELDNGWLTIWLNQPEKRNAFTNELRDELIAILKHVRNDRTVRGITLRGRGGVFCAGGDLKMFQSVFQESGTREDVIKMSTQAAEIFDLTNSAPQVVIVLIEGAAIAGGFGLACCADVVICERDAKFAMTEINIGLSPAQISPFVMQRLGYATGRRLMVTGARFKGEEALSLGVADFIGDNVADLEAIEKGIRNQVLAAAPEAVADTKSLIVSLPQLDRAQQIEAAAENFTDRILSDQAKEGIASFLEKRRPAWAVKVDD